MKSALAIIMLSCIIASTCFMSDVYATDAIGRLISDTTWTRAEHGIAEYPAAKMNLEQAIFKTHYS